MCKNEGLPRGPLGNPLIWELVFFNDSDGQSCGASQLGVGCLFEIPSFIFRDLLFERPSLAGSSKLQDGKQDSVPATFIEFGGVGTQGIA